jgi:hypothetical protein
MWFDWIFVKFVYTVNIYKLNHLKENQLSLIYIYMIITL